MDTFRNVLIALVIAGLPACSNTKKELTPDEDVAEKPSDTDPSSESEFDPVAAYSAGADAFSAGNIEKALVYFTEDTSWEEFGSPRADGKEGVSERFGEIKDSFGDLRVRPVRIFVLGKDFIVVEGASAGTHTGSLRGVEATNEKIGNRFIHLVWFDGEKISKVEVVSNPMTVLKQIGKIELPKGQAAPKIPTLPSEPELITGESDDDNAAVATAYFKAIQDGNAEAFSKLITEDFELVHHGRNATFDVSAVLQSLAGLQNAFEGFTFKPEKIWTVGDWVIARAEFGGTHSGPFMDLSPLGNEVSVRTVNLLEVKDGKIARHIEYINAADFLDQLTREEQASK